MKLNNESIFFLGGGGGKQVQDWQLNSSSKDFAINVDMVGCLVLCGKLYHIRGFEPWIFYIGG